MPKPTTASQQQQQQQVSRNKKKQLHHTIPIAPPFSLYNNETPWRNVVNLLAGRKKIIVLTGAGVSVSCGIPDFRSKSIGLYETLDAQSLGLSCPEELFDIHFFRDDPSPFYKFAKQLYFPGGGDPPTRVCPSDTHKLLARLDQEKMLLRVYSQNIDGLEETAGVNPTRIVYAHGSLKFATCEVCRSKVPASEFEADILAGRVARCQVPKCVPTTPQQMIRRSTRKRSRPAEPSQTVCGGVLKPGVTFFGEALQDTVKTKLEVDREKVDALIVIGTSLSVAPISKVIDYLPKSIPRILINRNIAHPPPAATTTEDNFRSNYVFDAYLLGNCDDVMRALETALFETTNIDHKEQPPCEVLASIHEHSQYAGSLDEWDAVTVPRDRVLLFPGAEPPKRSLTTSVHRHQARCDSCDVVIKGMIHTCSICFDYDLCRHCYPVACATHFDGMHLFQTEVSLD